MASNFFSLFLLGALTLGAQCGTPARPALPKALANPAFQEGALEGLPKGWAFPQPCQDAGYTLVNAEEPGAPGRRCLVLSRDTGTAAFGNVMQSLDATPYRGKRIRLRSALRVEHRDQQRGSGMLWLRVDRPGHLPGFFDNMSDRPVTTGQWTPAEIVGDVAGDAEALALGAMLSKDNGRLWIRPFTLEILGDAPRVAVEGPRALTPQGQANLVAFTRALNYVRFFHPTDAAARADWARLAKDGARAVEGAADSADLAKRLQTLFAPYAPGAQWLTAGRHPKLPPTPKAAAFLVRWKHVGFGQGQQDSAYHSTREYLPLAGRSGSGWADPAAPATLDLGAGVWAWLPSVCFADAGRATLPKASQKLASGHPAAGIPAPGALPEPTGVPAGSGDDRATRLGDVALAWGVFQHFYPYFEVVGTDWQAELPKALAAAALDPDGVAFQHTLARLTAALKDGHVSVSGVDHHANATPALALAWVDGQPVVRAAGPSAQKIPPGSRILSVDGEPAAARIARLTAETSAASRGWLETRLGKAFLAGSAAASATIGFAAPDGTAAEAVVPRETTAWTFHAPLPDQVAELQPGVWYVDLDRINDADFQRALPKLAQAKGILFDLRGYPRMGPTFLSHLTDVPLTSARWNIPVVVLPDGQGWTWETSGRWDLQPLKPRLAAKVAFLTGGGAISYAESCLGIVEAYKLADIVGEPTAGTNGNINPFTLPGGYHINWTGMKVLKHDGSRHHGVGILPTVPVKPTLRGLAEGRDEVLEKGLEVVSR